MSSWLLSTTCSGPFNSISSATSTFDKVQEWIAYILFSECPQHSIAAVINIVFFLHWLISSTISRPVASSGTKIRLSGASRLTWRFLFTLFSAFTLAAISVGMTILFASPSLINANSWDSTSDMIRETFFSAIEALTWIASIAILNKEKRLCTLIHPLALRTWWFTSFLVAILFLISSIVRLSEASGFSYDLLLEIVDTYALVKFLVLAFIFWVTVDGHTGLVLEPDSLRDPLLAEKHEYGAGSMNGKEENVEFHDAKGITSGFASANIFSKAAFTWLTPLLMAGSKRTLEIRDVPALAPRDCAENMYDFLRSRWPQDPRHLHPLRAALIKAFWPQVLLTGVFQLIRTIVIYAGPLLINSFSSYASGDRSSVFDGYVLVILLLTAKLVELFAYHQYNFQCYRMGNNVRTAVVTTLYRKSLRLSSSARQKHGVGQITNYMVVDAQQLSDACLQLHLCWSLPLQVIIALVLLYQVIGIPAFAGIATMIVITLITFLISQRQKHFIGLLMKARDRRMKSITEVLAYMKVIKLQAWEEKFEEKVVSERKAEFNSLSQFVYNTAGSMFTLWNTLPIVSLLTYVTAVLLDTGLTTATVFTASSVFRIVQEPIRNFPQAAFTFSQLVISLERLDTYMLSSDLEEGAVEKVMGTVGEEYPVVIQGGYFAWNETQETPTLHDINLNIRRGSLVTIVGPVGSGKSSLLAALLGEMLKVSGMARIAGSIAYVSQTAWIQNATIKENILFGSEAVEDRYKEVIHACGLEPDFASMEYGDETEIGEKGINLSGGQKQRIQLARAVYQDSDVYLLDDVFSAVDAHTGSHLFKKCILGLLKEKTILLVTHQVEFLTGADLVVVMKEGKVTQSGIYHDILTAGSDFADIVAAHNQSMDMVDKEEYWTSDQNETKIGSLIAHSSQDILKKQGSNMGATEKELEKLSSSRSLSSNPPNSDSFSRELKALDASSKLIEEEKRETGHVSWSVYWLYLTKAFGWMTVIVLAINQSSWQACLLASDYWLANEIPESSDETINNKTRFILVYALLNAAAITGILVRVIVVAAFGLRTAQIFFLDMLHSIFRAPMSFFDTTPSGRILSRFSGDQTNLDFLLHFFVGGSISTYFSTLGALIVVSISTWPILLLIAPLSLMYYWYQKLFITSSREITRLDSITKAPVIYHFSETVAGLETIRCFRKQEDFAQKSLDRVNTNMRMDFHNSTANEWLGLRLEAIGTAILCTTAFLFVVLPTNLINSDTVALALSYALSLNSALFTTVFLTCNIENKMVAVERIRQYTTIPEEAEHSIPNCLPSCDWPTKGQIVSKRLKLRYRPGTPLVLKGVNFSIEGGENVGVVGRTGSGKSTLILALFRLVEPVGGQVWIDNVDISTIGLHDLRKRLGIIPQDPVLFEGTIRTNLDPCNVYSDDEIWQALKKCQLANIIKENPGKLETSVTESGSNWSVGQRQLLCFGRALLKHSKILFLDEATASVDTQTDVVIQGIIREEFKESTVVSIAHRIPTVMDSDKVIVMEAGLVKEFDSPSNLLQNPNSVFASLVHEYSSRAGR